MKKMMMMLMMRNKRKGGLIMAILAECPICRKKQHPKNERRNTNFVNATKTWISPNDHKRSGIGSATGCLTACRDVTLWELEGLNAYSKSDAEIALSKREVQKREKRILDMLPESTITFRELSEWYLGLRLK
jgi:hypothetical protein